MRLFYWPIFFLFFGYIYAIELITEHSKGSLFYEAFKRAKMIKNDTGVWGTGDLLPYIPFVRFVPDYNSLPLPNFAPYFVLIEQIVGFPPIFCGGAILSREFILTASRCLYHISGQSLSKRDILIEGGISNFRGYSNGIKAKIIDVVPYSRHFPNFSPYFPSFENKNLALIKVEWPENEWNRGLMRPIKLGGGMESLEENEEKECFMLSVGDKKDRKSYGILKKNEVKKWRKEDEAIWKITDFDCAGEAGSPLICMDFVKNSSDSTLTKEPVLQGIVLSFNRFNISQSQCGPETHEKHSLIGDVKFYKYWIVSQVFWESGEEREE